MRFDKFIPSEKLRPYIKELVISEGEAESTYKVFPSPGLVLGFQYRGGLSVIGQNTETSLAAAGITGILGGYRHFRQHAGTGTVLVYFTEVGFAAFTRVPVNELFNESLSLTEVFTKDAVAMVEEKLAAAQTDRQRIAVTERFLLSELKNRETDRLVVEAVRLIYASGGTIQVADLHKRLFTSASPLEKRFRRIVGATPKKFAAVVRFNAVMDDMGRGKSLSEICHENNFFDHAHFIQEFRRFTGDTPDHFRKRG